MAYKPYKMKGHTLPGIKQSPAKQGVLMSDEKKHGTIKEQQAANKAFAESRAKFEKTRRSDLTDDQRAKEDSTSNANMQQLRDAMKPKKRPDHPPQPKGGLDMSDYMKKSPAKCPLIAALPAITGAIGAVGAMKKKKEEQ